MGMTTAFEGVLAELAGVRASVNELQAERTVLLEVLALVAPSDPMNQDEQGGCVWCGGPNDASMYSTRDPATHFSDCAWVAARRLLGDDFT